MIRQPLPVANAPPTAPAQPKKKSFAEPETSWLVDLALLAFVLALVAGGVWFAKQSSAPFRETVVIDLSPSALPGYALLSFLRGLIAYVLSFFFTLAYGTIAAKNRRAERVMIPLLDVLQGIPVLGFLPPVVLGMINLFPRSNVGLELACIITIFTGQVWNMTFSFYGALRAIPTELVEVARVHRFSWWRRFSSLELPAAAIGLVWNSMMSMAGGWFFLMISEAFQLNGVDYRLPGIGSYMSEAYRAFLRKENPGTIWPIIWAVVAMIVVIVVTDHLIWRPLIAWSQKFKIEETEAAEAPTSRVLAFIRRSRALWKIEHEAHKEPEPAKVATALARPAPPPLEPMQSRAGFQATMQALAWTIAIATALLSCYGAWKLLALLARESAAQWLDIFTGLLFTSIRTFVALALGSLWTVPVGVAIGLNPRLAKRAQPVVQVLASFPAPMLFPLMTLAIVRLFGVSAFQWWGCTLLTLFGAQWYILFNVIAGAMTIPHDLREATDVYHVKGWARWKTLYLPGIFPHLLTGLITAAGGAWNAAIVTEYVSLTPDGDPIMAHGLGSLISQAAGNDYGRLAASILVLTLALVCLNRFVWKKLYRWSDETFALNR